MAQDYVTKRLNYYNGQFLRVDDFKDEQLHHDRERALRGRMLQVWGITEGLGVTVPNNATIEVAPGAAVDGSGRLILLMNLTTMGVAASTPPGLNYIVIGYAEQPSDPAAPQDVPGNTRIEQAPSLSLKTAVSPGEIVLGRVSVVLGGGGALVLDPLSLDTSVRAYAGARLPGPGDEGFDLRTGADDHVSLERYQAGDVGFTRLVSVSGGGNVGVGVTSPAQRLVVADRVGIGFNDAGQTAGLAVNGRIGIGTIAPQVELEVVGQVRITGGAPADGRVLVSDASGTGTWAAISAGNLADGSVTTNKLADGSVTTSKLANGAVISIKLADGAVTGQKIANSTVTPAKIVGGAVGSVLTTNSSGAAEWIQPSTSRSVFISCSLFDPSSFINDAYLTHTATYRGSYLHLGTSGDSSASLFLPSLLSGSHNVNITLYYSISFPLVAINFGYHTHPLNQGVPGGSIIVNGHFLPGSSNADGLATYGIQASSPGNGIVQIFLQRTPSVPFDNGAELRVYGLRLTY